MSTNISIFIPSVSGFSELVLGFPELVLGFSELLALLTPRGTTELLTAFWKRVVNGNSWMLRTVGGNFIPRNAFLERNLKSSF